MLKRRDEVTDVASYADKLSPDEKAWMNQFMKEYNDASTQDAVFHTDAATRKICNDKNNARNRCWYTEEAAANRLNLVESDFELEQLIYQETSISDPSEPEDELI
jgi:aminopeptidase C